MSKELPYRPFPRSLYETIDALVEEFQWLDGQMRQAPGEDVDFLMAHAHFEAQGRIRQMLSRLNSFRSKSEVEFDRLTSQLRRMIKTDHTSLPGERMDQDDYMTNFMAKQIAQYQSAIKDFQFTELEITIDHSLEKYIEELVHKKLEILHIKHFQEEMGEQILQIRIELLRREKNFEIIIIDVQDEFYSFVENRLHSLGYRAMERVYRYSIPEHEIDVKRIMILLARTTYEALQINSKYFQSYIELPDS